MRPLFVLFALCGAVLCAAAAGPRVGQPQQRYGWTRLPIDFTGAPWTANQALSSGVWVPQNCVLTGIKTLNGSLVLGSIPRWRQGVPATLLKLQPGGGPDGGPSWTAWPSWDMQVVGNPDALQYVQSMEVGALVLDLCGADGCCGMRMAQPLGYS